MAVALHHLLGDVPRDGHDRHVRRLPLGQLADGAVPQIVEAAVEASLLESITPRGTPTIRGARVVNVVVLAPGEYEVVGLCIRIASAPAE